MTQLSNKTLGNLDKHIQIPKYDRSALQTGIVQFGVGNFHRVHQAPLIDDYIERTGDLSWGITGVGVTASASSKQKAEGYNKQDGLYTITELTNDEPQPARVIGAMRNYIYAPSEGAALMALLADINTRIISLTITEGGYEIDQNKLSAELDFESVFSILVHALNERKNAGKAPFTIMSCDNLPRNGDTSRAAIMAYANALDTDLAAWIEANVEFPNSMVDRIAPAISEADRDRLNAQSGIDDAFPATYEPYSAWVVEDKFSAGRPDLMGPIEFRDDATDFVQVKGRVSNAAHMLMSYPSLILGNRKVHEGMEESRVPKLISVFWEQDVFHLVPNPPGFSVNDFANSVLDRFADPLINDSLERVANDGASKFKAYYEKTLEDIATNNASFERIAFLFASYWYYLSGKDAKGQTFKVWEPRITKGEQLMIDPQDPLSLLKLPPFDEYKLSSQKDFQARYLEIVMGFQSQGYETTLDALLETWTA